MNNSPLRAIRNWPQLAHEASYSVSVLAESCNASVRTLERFFLSVFGDTPRRWLKLLRMQRAIELLRDGSTMKETASALGYEDPSHFSREFKHYRGVAPKSCSKARPKAAARSKLSHSAMKLSR